MVSQFTLYADTRKGRRPSFTGAADPALAETLVESYRSALEAEGVRTAGGRFGGNDGGDPDQRRTLHHLAGLGRPQGRLLMSARSIGRFVLREILVPLVMAFVLALIIQATVAKPFEIPTASMDPTVKPGDRVLANRVLYRFRDVHRGDIVVFNPPKELDSDVPFVKRVVGLPGDTVEISDGRHAGERLPLRRSGRRPPRSTTTAPRPCLPDRLFVLGDNRNNSVDSHDWGFLARKEVIGQVFMTYWPLTRMHIF